MKQQQAHRSPEVKPETSESVRREINLSAQVEGIAPSNPTADCEVIEYDPETGDAVWKDTVFVQDFTDSVLQTIPAPLSD